MTVRRARLVLIARLALAVTPAAAPAAPSGVAKKCKKGYRLVTVEKGARKKKVGKEKKARPAGPTVAQVEAIIRGTEADVRTVRGRPAQRGRSGCRHGPSWPG